MERTGIRVCDVNKKIIEDFNHYIHYHEFAESLEFLLSLQITNIEYYLNQNDINILAEGAQGSLLDVDFGTYPYVSSSNSTIGGVMTGLGVSHNKINKVYGVFKAYMTRVGNGPFITELKDEIGEKIRELGGEFGATTGRPRRCGWLDLPALRYACMINGVTDLIMTKSDILNGFEEIQVCEGYTYIDPDDGYPYSFYRYDNKVYCNESKPIYKTFKGWNDENKEPLEEYIKFIENEIGIPISMVSDGKDRNNIYKRD